jgi:hypothetical protein
MKRALLVLAPLLLGGCLSDADTANNRSVLPLAASSKADRGGRDTSDAPRQLCESTSEGGEPKTVCY